MVAAILSVVRGTFVLSSSTLLVVPVVKLPVVAGAVVLSISTCFVVSVAKLAVVVDAVVVLVPCTINCYLNY